MNTQYMHAKPQTVNALMAMRNAWGLLKGRSSAGVNTVKREKLPKNTVHHTGRKMAKAKVNELDS
ncbi:MAG: hypothetical protein KBH75_07305 [Saprospiraceae bacterium]|nr:hypothetical protein [Saprospiraceae bacterium]